MHACMVVPAVMHCVQSTNLLPAEADQWKIHAWMDATASTYTRHPCMYLRLLHSPDRPAASLCIYVYIYAAS
jgi:hypothetical protein